MHNQMGTASVSGSARPAATKWDKMAGNRNNHKGGGCHKWMTGYTAAQGGNLLIGARRRCSCRTPAPAAPPRGGRAPAGTCAPCSAASGGWLCRCWRSACPPPCAAGAWLQGAASDAAQPQRATGVPNCCLGKATHSTLWAAARTAAPSIAAPLTRPDRKDRRKCNELERQRAQLLAGRLCLIRLQGGQPCLVLRGQAVIPGAVPDQVQVPQRGQRAAALCGCGWGDGAL